MSWLYLALAIFCEVIGTSALTASGSFTRILPTGLALTAFAVSLFFLSMALKSIPVGIAYAIWSGVGIVLISIIGYVFLRQSLDLAAMAGIGLILMGVLVINLFSQAGHH